MDEIDANVVDSENNKSTSTTPTTTLKSTCPNIVNSSSNVNSSLLTCAFNQDGGCLAIGTTSGFSVHNIYQPHSQQHYSVSVDRVLTGGVGIIEMLFRCNLMVLVGGGPYPVAPPHRVLIHDDHVNRPVGELSFRQVVLATKLRKDTIAVALRDRVYVYHLADLSLRDKIYTADNPHGLLCLSTQIQDMVLACPSVTTGHVRVELYGSRKTVLMEAHESQLRGLALTPDGTKVATASTKGTVIRVWDVATALCVQEFRRGVERANITCLSWSWDHNYLCCTSDKGTAHVFHLDIATKSDNKKQSDFQPSLSLTQKLFSSVRKSVEGDAKKSICQIRGVPHPMACTFVSTATNLVAVAGWDADGNGVLLLSEFDSNACSTGSSITDEPRRVGYHILCKSNSIRADETEEARRRRRLRGWTPEIPPTPEGGRLYVGERLEILERGMEQIQFEEGGQDDDEFVSVTTVVPVQISDTKIDATIDTNHTEDKVDLTNSTNDPNSEASVFCDSAQTDEQDPATLFSSATEQ